ncbi:MAG: hypothetical protein LBN30_01815 [Oscillospiraceae bacterium]|jgi:hypothetical protein|nr:hypothetical protein [Oscillospiraceae bacterium]
MSKDSGRTLINVIKGYGLGLVMLIAIVLIVFRGLSSTEDSSRTEQKRMLGDSIRRAMVTCYAMEGSYPESLDYMKNYYGVRVDETKFIVHYNVFASNIMPNFDVLER